MEPFKRPRQDDSPNHKLVKLLAHPVRASLLGLFAEHETVTPRQALDLLELERRSSDEQLTPAQVNYHVRLLADAELVVAADLPAAGGVSLYRATDKGVEVMAMIGLARKAAE